MTRHSKKLLLSFSSFLFLGASSCALFGGGSTDHPRATNYKIAAPKNWKTINNQDESDYAYELASKNIATLSSSCTQKNKISLESLTKQLLYGSKKIKYHKQRNFEVDSTEGLYSSVESTLEGKPFYIEIFILQRQNCVFDFSLISPKLISESEKEEFINFIKSFKYGNS